MTRKNTTQYEVYNTSTGNVISRAVSQQVAAEIAAVFSQNMPGTYAIRFASAK